MANPRFDDIEDLLQAGNYEAAGVAFGMVFREITKDNHEEEDVISFVEEMNGELV